MATSRKRNVEIDVVVDDKQARAGLKGLAGEAQTTGKKFSDTAKLIGISLAAGAGAAIASFVKGSVESFSNLNESLNAVQVSFGGSADEVKRLGKEAAKSVGLSNAEFNSLAVQLSAFAKTIAGDSGDVAGTIGTLTTRVADFASVMNLDVAEAARLFQSGLAGETEPLRKFGIDLSAAAVNAHGLAMGLGDSSGQLSEQEKILSRYDSLMEQTNQTAGDFANTSDDLANAQRIAAAEAENARAAIGESLAPAIEAATPIIAEAAKGVGILALEAMRMAGQISDSDAAIRQFELSMGTSAESAEALLTIWKEWHTPLKDLIAAIPLTTDEINKLRGADEDFLRSLGMTQDEIDEMNRLLGDKLVSAAREARDKGMHPVKKSIDDAAVAADEATEATETYADTLRALVDPAFNLFQKIAALDDAQTKYNEALDEFGPKSEEAQDAAVDLGEAIVDLEGASSDYAAAGGKESLDALIKILTQAGVARDTIREIIAAIKDLNKTPIKGPLYDKNGNIVHGGKPLEQRAKGGSVLAGQSYTVGEEGPETLVMGSQSGHIIPNGAGDGSGSGTTIIVQGYVGSEAQLAAEIDRLLTNRKRRNGLSFT